MPSGLMTALVRRRMQDTITVYRMSGSSGVGWQPIAGPTRCVVLVRRGHPSGIDGTTAQATEYSVLTETRLDVRPADKVLWDQPGIEMSLIEGHDVLHRGGFFRLTFQSFGRGSG